MFIFDKCRHSSAAVTPAKYECDAKNLTGALTGWKILLTEKLTNRALVTPTPDELNISMHHLDLFDAQCGSMNNTIFFS